MSEIWDVCDENRNITGKIILKSISKNPPIT